MDKVYEHERCIHYAGEIYCRMYPGLLATDVVNTGICLLFLLGLIIVGYILGRMSNG